MDMNSTNTSPTGDDVIAVSLPANLLAQIDAQVGAAFADREDFVRAAVRSYLEHMQESQGTQPTDMG